MMKCLLIVLMLERAESFHAPMIHDMSMLTAANIPILHPWLQAHGDTLVYGSGIAGGAAAAVLMVTHPAEMLRLSLTALTPMATHLERARSRKQGLGRLARKMRYKDLTLPSLDMLQSSCCLLESSAIEDVFICRKSDKSIGHSDPRSCQFSLDFSECTRRAAGGSYHLSSFSSSASAILCPLS